MKINKNDWNSINSRKMIKSNKENHKKILKEHQAMIKWNMMRHP